MAEDLVWQLSKNYDLDFSNSVPYRDGFIMIDPTEPHSLLIKKSDLSADRIMFNHLTKTHLIQRGFAYTDRYVPTKDGLPYIIINDQIYTVVTKINGTEAYFENTYDISKTALALASMHAASPGGSCDLEKYPFSTKDLGRLPDIFKHRVNELKKFRKIAARGKSFFDYEYTKNAGRFIEDGERAIEEIESSKYTELVQKTLDSQSLCHHDLTSHNIIFHEGNTYITGFDNCCIEIKEYDIANFIRRKMRRTGWSISDAKLIIDNYRSVCKLNEDELEILKIILIFPQKFWRIVNKFYNSKRSWCERGCLEKMNDVIEEKEPLHSFLNSFDVLY